MSFRVYRSVDDNITLITFEVVLRVVADSSGYSRTRLEASEGTQVKKKKSEYYMIIVVGLILTKTSVMRISVPFDLSSRPFIPLPRFILLAPSLVFSLLRSAMRGFI